MGRGTHEPCIQSHAISIRKASKELKNGWGLCLKLKNLKQNLVGFPNVVVQPCFVYYVFFVCFLYLFVCNVVE